MRRIISPMCEESSPSKASKGSSSPGSLPCRESKAVVWARFRCLSSNHCGWTSPSTSALSPPQRSGCSASITANAPTIHLSNMKDTVRHLTQREQFSVSHSEMWKCGLTIKSIMNTPFWFSYVKMSARPTYYPDSITNSMHPLFTQSI